MTPTDPPAAAAAPAPTDAAPAPPPGWRLWRLLPLWLVAGMVALGVLLELLRFGDVRWLGKLPIALLLALALRRR